MPIKRNAESQAEDAAPWRPRPANIAEELNQAKRCFLAGLGIISALMARLPPVPGNNGGRKSVLSDAEVDIVRREGTRATQERVRNGEDAARVLPQTLVKQRREAMDLTQRELAERANVSNQTIYAIETGRISGKRMGAATKRVYGVLHLPVG